MEIKKIGYCFKVAIHSFMSIFQLILLDPPKIDNSSVKSGEQSDFSHKSLNQMSNNKITSFKLPRTDYHPTCIGDIFPYPLFQTSEFRINMPEVWAPCIFCAKGSPIDLTQILRESTQDHNEQCTNMCHPSTFFAIVNKETPAKTTVKSVTGYDWRTIREPYIIPVFTSLKIENKYFSHV